MAGALTPLFAPSSVALVGASPDFGRYGGRVLRFLSAFGFEGPIWSINPKYQEIQGRPCFPSLRALPGTPDHVGIVVSPERVLSVLQDCASLGVGAVTVFTAGFAESGAPEGRAEQERIAAFARESGIRVLGPNCNGVINWAGRFAMTGTAAVLGNAPPGSVGVVSQSGGLGQVNVMWRAIQAGLGISYQASCGNEVDVDTLDVVDFMLDDPGTRVVLMAVERLGARDKLEAIAAKAAEKRKPILVLKLGRSELGSRAAASHTGAITGSDAVHDAVLRQLGLLRVRDAQHLYQAALLFQQGRSAMADGVSSVSVSGGNIVLVADEAERFGLDFPPYARETLKILSKLIPGFISVGNPTDLSPEAIGNPEAFGQVLDAIAADPGIGVTLPILTLAPRRDFEAAKSFVERTSKPAGLIWTGGCLDGPSPEKDQLFEGVPVFRDIDTALRSAGLLVRHQAHLRRRATRAVPVRPAGTDAEWARELLRSATASPAMVEREAKRLLAAYGIPVTRERLATSPEEAVAALRTLGGPIAMKIEAPEVLHKSDVGGVKLGIADERAAAEAYDAILTGVGKAVPGARINGVLVQEMVPPGLEMILGASRDPSYGPVIALGFGGTLVELLGTPALRLPPLAPDDAAEMLAELPGRKLLDGVRGAAPRDRVALIDVVVRFSWLVADLGESIAEIDLNPVILREEGSGAVAVDALVVRS